MARLPAIITCHDKQIFMIRAKFEMSVVNQSQIKAQKTQGTMVCLVLQQLFCWKKCYYIYIYHYSQTGVVQGNQNILFAILFNI